MIYIHTSTSICIKSCNLLNYLNKSHNTLNRLYNKKKENTLNRLYSKIVHVDDGLNHHVDPKKKKKKKKSYNEL